MMIYILYMPSRRMRRPRRRPIGRRPRRRLNRKRKLTKPETVTIRGPSSVIPDKYRVILHADDMYSGLTGSTGTANPDRPLEAPDFYSTIIYGANSIDNKGGLNDNGTLYPNAFHSIEDLGIDQLWAGSYALYRSARVNAAAINVQFVNTGTDVYRAVVWPSAPLPVSGNGGAGNMMTFNDFMEQPYARVGTLTSGQGSGKLIIKNFMSTKKIFGYNKIDQDDRFIQYGDLMFPVTPGPPVAVPPQLQWFWNIAIQSLTLANTYSAVTVQVRFSDYIDFFDKRTLTNCILSPGVTGAVMNVI